MKDKWADEANVNNIELVDKEFTTVNLEERRADVIYKINLSEVKEWIKNSLDKDYDDLSDRTKEFYKEEYKLLLEKVHNDEIKQVNKK